MKFLILMGVFFSLFIPSQNVFGRECVSTQVQKFELQFFNPNPVADLKYFEPLYPIAFLDNGNQGHRQNEMTINVSGNGVFPVYLLFLFRSDCIGKSYFECSNRVPSDYDFFYRRSDFNVSGGSDQKITLNISSSPDILGGNGDHSGVLFLLAIDRTNNCIASSKGVEYNLID